MQKKNIYLIGGGGHCISCIDVIELEGIFEVIGIFDNKLPVGSCVLSYNVIGTDENIKEYISEDNYFLITIGQIKNYQTRFNIFNNLVSLNAKIATVISPLSYVSKHAQVGIGCIIMHGATINASSSVGDNCIINTNSLIEHGSLIGSHSHISTSAIVNGDCKIGEFSFIGSNSSIEQQSILPEKSIVSSGIFFRAHRPK